MATGETNTKVKTIINISYSLQGGDDAHLLRREIRRVKDETLNEFVTVLDQTVDVGEKDDWRDALADDKDLAETSRDDYVNSINDRIEILDDQITEIDSL